MMDASLLSNLVAYSAQVTCIAAIGSLLPLLLRIDTPSFRYGYWRALLALCVVLPWLQGRQELASVTMLTTYAAVQVQRLELPASPAAALNGGVDWLLMIGVGLTGGALVRVLWMGASFIHLRRLRSAGAARSAL